MRVTLTHESKSYEFCANTNIIKKYEPLCTLVYLNKDSLFEQDTFTATIDKEDKWVVRLFKLLCVSYFANESRDGIQAFFRSIVDKVLRRLQKYRTHQCTFYEQRDLEWLLHEHNDIQRALKGFWGLSNVEFVLSPTQAGDVKKLMTGQRALGVCLQFYQLALQNSYGLTLDFVLDTHIEELIRITKGRLGEFFYLQQKLVKIGSLNWQDFLHTSCNAMLNDQRSVKPAKELQSLQKLMDVVGLTQEEKTNNNKEEDVWKVFFHVLHTWVTRHFTKDDTTDQLFTLTLFEFFREVADSAHTLSDQRTLTNALILCFCWHFFLNPAEHHTAECFHKTIHDAFSEQVFSEMAYQVSDELLARFLKDNARRLGLCKTTMA